jgi:hypothetical protein
MSDQDIPTPKDAINEYFKLKSIFENEISVRKKKIMNNPSLSKREKRMEYLKFMPKCVNCKKPSKKGTLFSSVLNPETENEGGYRKYSVKCGNLVDPCNLDIEIHLGENEPLDKLIQNIRDEIKVYKNKIIDDKNRLLFGLITTETALENFDLNKSYINELTSVYEMYLDHWTKIIDNPDNKIKLDEMLILSYENIHKIKDYIKKMNENDDMQFAVDAANIYTRTLKPLLDKIRLLKYKENIVYHDEYDSKCKLIQRPYSDLTTLISGYPDKVIKYKFGFETKKVKKNNPINDNEEFLIKPINNSSSSGGSNNANQILKDNPIFGKGNDGIEWSVKEYKDLWAELPASLKNEFKTNINWMKSFMEKCVNDKINDDNFNGCKLITPPNFILPPRQMSNGEYDFGVAIYNKVFNSMPKSSQDTYLTYYKEDPETKIKNYSQLEDELNLLVEAEVSKDSDVMIFEGNKF